MASAEALAAVHITKFLAKTEERAEFNQYYYSKETLKALLGAIRELGKAKIAFLSTPSVYFSLAPKEREGSWVFDLDDEQFGKDPRFVKYDFNHPDTFPEELRGAFDVVVIDPPFITRDVWEQYQATAIALLSKPPHAPEGAPPKAALDGGETLGGGGSGPGSKPESGEAVDSGASASSGDASHAAADRSEASAGFDRGLVLLTTIAENKDMMQELLGAQPCRFRPCIPNLVYQYDMYTNFEASSLAEPNPEVPDPDSD